MKQEQLNHLPEEAVYRNYRDTLFRFLFQNERHKEWALSLFNVLNHTSYDDPSELVFGITEEKIVYIAVREDVTFILESILQLLEHQTLFTPNLPFRMLEYSTKQLSTYAETEHLNEYGPKRISLPKPRCVVIYNGKDKNVPEETILKLSDLYQLKEGETLGNGFDVEVLVHVLNVNLGYNEAIQKGCKPLEEYCWIINSVYDLMDQGTSQNEAVQTVIAQLPTDFVIRDEIMNNRAMVIKLMLDEMSNERKIRYYGEACFADGIAEGEVKGFAKGEAKGRAEGREKTANKMLADQMPDELILKYTDITQEQLDEIKRNLQAK